MEDLRIGIIGAGNLATKRIYPYIGTAGGHLVGVCDLDPEKAARNARRFGGKAYTNYIEMIEKEKPDAVMVCIGPEQHAELAPEILKLGLPVYTEKPPAPTAKQTLEIARLAQKTGLLCTTAFKKRYTIASNRAKDWLSKFAPEDYYSISVDYCSAQYANQTPRSDFLLDFAIHLIDLIPYLFGDVDEVFCYAKGKDAYAVAARFLHGGVGSFNFNCGRSFQVPTEEIELTVRGGNFMTIHNSSVWRITENEKPCEWREPTTFVSSGDSGNDTGHLAEIVDFFAALREGRSTRSEIYQSYKSMVFYEAIKTSAETGQAVKVKYETL